MNELIQKIFDNRGYTRDYLLDINNPNHALLKDIDLLCEKLYDIKSNHKNIVVLPDFDTDGIMSGVIGFAGLAELGFHVSLFIPNPKDGYGFTSETIDTLAAQYPGTDAIITCDVGITCHDGIKHAKELGFDVLITDHHRQFTVDSNADVIVNPMRIDESYAHPAICGAYVLYQILERYSSLYENAFVQEQIRRLSVFAGIGTISDIMPLLFENREIVRDSVSISRLIYSDGDDIIAKYIAGNDIYRRAFYGLHWFYKILAEHGSLNRSTDITEEFYAFYLAPIFNSVKRMEGDITRAFGVFFGSSPDEDAEYLLNLNSQRKSAVVQYMNELNDTSQPYAPYLYITSAPKGILGLMATRIMEQTGEPVMVVNHDGRKFTGSGRSPEWYAFLTRVTEQGFYAAGHDSAFGIGITDKKELKSLLTFLGKDIGDVRSGLTISEVKPDFVIDHRGDGDTVIDIDLFYNYLSELEYYRPFGKAFPLPDIRLKFNASDCQVMTIGSVNQHLKIILQYGFEVLCWNQGSRLDEITGNKDFEVTGKLVKNRFNNTVTVQFTGKLL